MQVTLRGFVKDLQANIQHVNVQSSVKIAKGSLASIEQYHRQCGRIEGMEQAGKLAKDMLTQLEDAADGGSDLPEMTP